MGRHVTKQPDGRYAVWSSVVDDFVLVAAELDELKQYLSNRLGNDPIERAIARAHDDGGRRFPEEWPEDGLRRWRDDLAHLTCMRPPPEGGPETAKERVEQCLGDSDEIARWRTWIDGIKKETHYDENGRETGASWWTPEELE